MNIGDYFLFQLVDVKTIVTTRDELILAFIPSIGFISCRYYNGSKTWVSNETNNQVYPTHYMDRIKAPFKIEISTED